MNNNLILARINAKMSQNELAEIIGVSRMTIIRWEQGKTEPTKTALEKLAKALNVSIGYLLGVAAPEKKSPVPEISSTGNIFNNGDINNTGNFNQSITTGVSGNADCDKIFEVISMLRKYPILIKLFNAGCSDDEIIAMARAFISEKKK